MQDPFEDYKVRLAAKLARQDQSDEALRKRAAAQAEREKDRTTWLGTDLGAKGESKAAKEDRKRKVEEGGVGKYLGAPAGAPGAAKRATGQSLPEEFGQDKKKKKTGGFGDFSAW